MVEQRLEPPGLRRAGGGAPIRVAHLTTVDMSLALLLETELRMDVAAGLETYGLSAPGPYVDRVTATGARHIPIPALTRSWDLRRDAAAVRELHAVLRELRPDVLHTHNPKTGVLGRVVGRLAGVPVVVNTCHGLWAAPDAPIGKRLMVYSAELAAAALSDAELYQNQLDRRTLARGVRQSKTRVVGNGTDLERFRPDVRAGRSLRSELGVAPEQVLVGGVGRLVVEKGVREFAGMASALAGKATFVWAGPVDPDKRDAVALARDGEVRYLGERSDMPALYNALDVFVLPSYREGFSRSAMEAAACGTAMVLSDIRGCREIGASERELLLVPPRDADALTAAVERLVRDPELRNALGAHARIRAQATFDQRRIALTSLETYHAVATAKGLDWCEEVS